MRLAVLLPFVLLLAAACSGGSDDTSSTSDDADPTAVTSATEQPAATGGSGDGTPSPTADDPEGNAASVATLFVAAGGSGVAIRSDCEDAARSGDAWADGTEVRVMQVGAGACEGWSLVFAGSGSWVRNEYLSEEAPAAAVASTGGGTPPSPGAPTSPPASSPPVSSPPARPLQPLTWVSPTGDTYTSDDLLAGAGTLRGGSSGFQPLGLVSVSWTGANSLCNPQGKYGSPASPTSVRNPHGEFGVTYGGDAYGDTNQKFFNSKYSAYNAQATLTLPRSSLATRSSAI